MTNKKITRITRNWQITLPKNLRARLSIGDYVIVEKVKKIPFEKSDTKNGG